MYPRFLILFLFLLCVPILHAQQGMWTWMHGNSPTDFSCTNNASAVYEACEWTDLQGKFWLFGGKDVNGNIYNYLEKFDPSTNLWSLVKAGTSSGTYGSQGIPATSNCPGPRSFGVNSWVDLAGNLWLFGGFGTDSKGHSGTLSDLWKYTISTNMWTWMSGADTVNSPGSYGILAVASASNAPPNRSESNASWVDASGNLWLFGGQTGKPPLVGAYSVLNDLWRYDVSSNIWTWMHGSNTQNPPGHYGTKGVASSTNDPPGRFTYSHFKDASGNLWLFAGAAGNWASYNDLWKYDPIAGMWTWMNGSLSTGNTGNAGTNCLISPTNSPLSRFENRACWTDACGDFYTFGGMNEDQYQNHTGFYNDMWRYNVASNEWVQINGTNSNAPTGNWGTVNVPSSSNTPNGRAGCVGFKDLSGNFWIYGGLGGATNTSSGTYYNNDLWRFVPDSTCGNIHGCRPSVESNFSLSTYNGCSPFYAYFTNNSTMATSYTWNFGDGGTSNAVNPVHVYSLPGTYTASLIASDASTTDTMTLSTYIHVLASPTGTCTASRDTACPKFPINFTASGSAGVTNYWWIFGDGTGGGGTSLSHSWINKGTYNVLTMISNSQCTDTIRTTILIAAPTKAITTASPDSACPGQSVNFVNSSISSNSYLWNFGDSTSSTISAPSHSWPTTGTHLVTLIAYAAPGCRNDTSICKVDILPNPVVTITVSGNTLIASQGQSYQWYFNGISIAGETNQNYIPSSNGTCSVFVTDIYGCIGSSTVFNYVLQVTEQHALLNEIAIYPNPTNGNFLLSFNLEEKNQMILEISDLLGQVVCSEQYPALIGQFKQDFNLRQPPGIYFVRIKVGDTFNARKLLIR